MIYSLQKTHKHTNTWNFSYSHVIISCFSQDFPRILAENVCLFISFVSVLILLAVPEQNYLVFLYFFPKETLIFFMLFLGIFLFFQFEEIFSRVQVTYTWGGEGEEGGRGEDRRK